jgi:hypothetical protein
VHNLPVITAVPHPEAEADTAAAVEAAEADPTAEEVALLGVTAEEEDPTAEGEDLTEVEVAAAVLAADSVTPTSATVSPILTFQRQNW